MIRDIRRYRSEDWPALWAILEPIFRAGETYGVRRDVSESEARDLWTGPGKTVFVAEDPESGAVLGSYYLKANGAGPASHVCNCGYAVSDRARGRGVATAMCEHSQREGSRLGYRSMQFNLVASSNEGAVRLWRKLGFDVVGTLPGAFRHPTLGFVDAFVMFKDLRPPEPT